MTIRTHLIRGAAVFGLAVALAVGLVGRPADAASFSFTGFDTTGTSDTNFFVVAGSGPASVSMQLILHAQLDSDPSDGVDGSISVQLLNLGPIVALFQALSGDGPGTPPDPPDYPNGTPAGTFSPTTDLVLIAGSAALPGGPYSLSIVISAALEPLIGTFAPELVVTVTDISSAVPIPGALPLFATGLGAFGFLHWRRKRRAQAA